VGAGCPAVCKCSAAPTVCPPGVSRVADGCGCCKVCAAQLNRDCGPARPCDHHKGLECNYGNAEESAGVSVDQEHHCTCVDGGVGCVPLCPAHVPLASPACPAPRLVKVPGRCCLQLDCRKGRAESPPGPLPYPYPHKPGKASPNELLEIGKGWEKKQSYKQLAGRSRPAPRTGPLLSSETLRSTSSRINRDVEKVDVKVPVLELRCVPQRGSKRGG
ncbi:hypothetical protein Z043_108118, partial [Scleropages formosus]